MEHQGRSPLLDRVLADFLAGANARTNGDRCDILRGILHEKQQAGEVATSFHKRASMTASP